MEVKVTTLIKKATTVTFDIDGFYGDSPDLKCLMEQQPVLNGKTPYTASVWECKGHRIVLAVRLVADRETETRVHCQMDGHRAKIEVEGCEVCRHGMKPRWEPETREITDDDSRLFLGACGFESLEDWRWTENQAKLPSGASLNWQFEFNPRGEHHYTKAGMRRYYNTGAEHQLKELKTLTDFGDDYEVRRNAALDRLDEEEFQQAKQAGATVAIPLNDGTSLEVYGYERIETKTYDSSYVSGIRGWLAIDGKRATSSYRALGGNHLLRLGKPRILSRNYVGKNKLHRKELHEYLQVPESALDRLYTALLDLEPKQEAVA